MASGIRKARARTNMRDVTHVSRFRSPAEIFRTEILSQIPTLLATSVPATPANAKQQGNPKDAKDAKAETAKPSKVPADLAGRTAWMERVTALLSSLENHTAIAFSYEKNKPTWEADPSGAMDARGRPVMRRRFTEELLPALGPAVLWLQGMPDTAWDGEAAVKEAEALGFVFDKDLREGFAQTHPSLVGVNLRMNPDNSGTEAGVRYANYVKPSGWLFDQDNSEYVETIPSAKPATRTARGAGSGDLDSLDEGPANDGGKKDF